MHRIRLQTIQHPTDYRLKNVKGNVENAHRKNTKIKSCSDLSGKQTKEYQKDLLQHEAQEIFADAVTGEKDGEKMQIHGLWQNYTFI